MRIVKIIGVLIVLAIAVAALYLRTPNTRTMDKSAIRETAQNYDARIIRDEWGVAHIFGQTDADTSFGLGYSQAEDDWATIQVTIQASRGESARYQGQGVAPADYLYDLFKVREAVETKIDKDLRPDVRALAKAYADALNLYGLEHPDETLPDILPITDIDVIAGFTWATPFFYRMDSILQPLFEAEDAPQVSPWRRESFLNQQTQSPKTVRGSNAFAIAPSRSEDGHTRLVLNSHQPYVGPYAWFEAHVVSESGYNVAGASFPGTPILTQGVTPHHGWAQTVNRPDLVDIYKLETDTDKNPTQYKLDGDWKDFYTYKSRFRVKLWGPFSLPIKRDALWSEHGPVLSTPTGHYAVRFSGLGRVTQMQQWYDMGKAQSLEEWKAAIDTNHILSFNMVYADRNGNIGSVYNARMPDRIEGPDWQEILPGDSAELIWKGFRPLSDLPQIYNPDCGWVFSANATPFQITDPACDNQREDYSATFGIEARMTNRARRSLELFTSDEAISDDDLLTYRADATYHPNSNIRKMVEEIIAMNFKGEPDLQSAQQVLANWDGTVELESRGAALAVLTGMKAMGFEFFEDLMPYEQALRETIDEMMQVYGRLDPEWREVNRIIRGDINMPLRGGPDTLRAVYGDRTNFVEKGVLEAAAGDTHMMIADWDEDGKLYLRSIHQFGAATLDETSPHYDDQAVLYANEEWKVMPMTLEEVLPKAARDYRPGE